MSLDQRIRMGLAGIQEALAQMTKEERQQILKTLTPEELVAAAPPIDFDGDITCHQDGCITAIGTVRICRDDEGKPLSICVDCCDTHCCPNENTLPGTSSTVVEYPND